MWTFKTKEMQKNKYRPLCRCSWMNQEAIKLKSGDILGLCNLFLLPLPHTFHFSKQECGQDTLLLGLPDGRIVMHLSLMLIFPVLICLKLFLHVKSSHVGKLAQQKESGNCLKKKKSAIISVLAILEVDGSYLCFHVASVKMEVCRIFRRGRCSAATLFSQI